MTWMRTKKAERVSHFCLHKRPALHLRSQYTGVRDQGVERKRIVFSRSESHFIVAALFEAEIRIEDGFERDSLPALWHLCIIARPNAV